MRRAQGMPVQVIGIIVLVVIVIVAIAVFFFAGLSEQGAVIGQTSEQTVGGLEGKVSLGITCLPPVICDPLDPAYDPAAANCPQCQT